LFNAAEKCETIENSKQFLKQNSETFQKVVSGKKNFFD